MFFQYFFPNRRKITLDQLLELGLGYVFEPETAAQCKTPFEPRPVSNGPGGQHGLVVSLSGDWLGFHQDLQEWKQELDTDYWVGMWTAADKRPTPETLARQNLITGQWLRLEDGHDWLIPMARHWVEFDDTIIYQRTLPTRLTRTEQGHWRSGDVKPRYRELWRLATEFLTALTEGTLADFTEQDNLVMECFRTNYRVSAIELDLLGIYDDHVRQRVPEILVDYDNFETLLKKKLTTPDTGDSIAGPAGSPPGEATEATILPSVT